MSSSAGGTGLSRKSDQVFIRLPDGTYVVAPLASSVYIEKIESIQNMLLAKATGQEADDSLYKTYRGELVHDEYIKPLIPRFVITSRSLAEFWAYIKTKFSTYRERREFIWGEFKPLLDELEKGSLSYVSDENMQIRPLVSTSNHEAHFQTNIQSQITRIKIFLSYAHEDLEEARKIYSQLKSYPVFDVWFDKDTLLPGQRWELEIHKAIKESRYFLLLLSKNSTSKKGFYQREIRLALDVLEEYPDNEIFLIPVRLDDCGFHFEQLNALQYVDLFPDWNAGFEKILRVLQARVSEVGNSGTNVIRATSHQAHFMNSPRQYYFINITNTSDKPIEMTHIWYEDSSNHIRINPKSRSLPVRLNVNQAWSTWIPADIIPESHRINAYDKFRIRLSTSEVYATNKENNIPPIGSVPGGSIDLSDL